MTSNTYAWAIDQTLPCAPKFVLVMLCDWSGMSRRYTTNEQKLADRVGLSIEDLADAFADLEDRRMLFVEERSGGDVTLFLNYPTQDFEVSGGPKSTYRRNDHIEGFLYVLSTSTVHGICKVGITTNVEARVASLRRGAVVDLNLAWWAPMNMTVARAREREILDHFAAVRFNGEWLRITADQVVAFARALITPPGGA